MAMAQMGETTKTYDQILRMEEALASDEVRTSKEALSTILHPDFLEIGKSGRMFSYSSIISDLTESQAASAYDIADFNITQIEEGVVLATYRIPTRSMGGTENAASLRSSLWVKEDDIWLLRFHQGTIIPNT